MRQGQNARAVDLLIMGQVPRNQRDPRIHRAHKGLQLQDLRNSSGLCEEGIEGTRLEFIQRDAQRNFDTVSQRNPIDPRADTFNDASLLHGSQASRQRCRRDVGPLCEGGLRRIRLGLKLPEDSSVCIAQHDFRDISRSSA